MFDYLRLIIINSLPFCMDKNSDLHKFSKRKHVFGIRHVKEVMLQLIELVEQSIEKEMKATKCALLQDAWTD